MQEIISVTVGGPAFLTVSILTKAQCKADGEAGKEGLGGLAPNHRTSRPPASIKRDGTQRQSGIGAPGGLHAKSDGSSQNQAETEHTRALLQCCLP